jgi:hypothetical protein
MITNAITKKITPDRCPEKHEPKRKCTTCGGFPPFPDMLTQDTDAPPERRWSYWYGNNIRWPDPDPATTTSPEQKAEIEAASAEYNRKREAHQRAMNEFMDATHAENAVAYPGLDFGTMEPIQPRPDKVAAAQARTNAAIFALDRASEKMTEALRHLNLVSVPPKERERRLADEARSRRRLRSV